MRTHRQREASRPAHTLWVRMLAVVCALLIGVASTAQAAHTHGELLPKNAPYAKSPLTASQLPPNEASCPLCVAMHSALPSAIASGTNAVAVAVRVDVGAVDHVVPLERHFARFGRPPPATRSL